VNEPPTARAVIAVGGLAKAYAPSVRALDRVSFTIHAGEFVGVLGPSGAGKTTLFRCLTGLTRADEGAVVVNGRDIARARGRALREARRDIALIFQQFNLIRRLTALQNVLVGRLAVVPTWRVLLRQFTRADRQLALACLDTVGLLDKAASRADQLSGGQQQRVAIARALAQDAKVILADEPVASLDPESSATVLESLRAAAAAGVAVVASLHQVHLATAYAERIIALRAGVLVEDLPVAGLDRRALEQLYERDGARRGVTADGGRGGPDGPLGESGRGR
jgi:phosphonate transport system ATP-binding protein